MVKRYEMGHYALDEDLGGQNGEYVLYDDYCGQEAKAEAYENDYFQKCVELNDVTEEKWKINEDYIRLREIADELADFANHMNELEHETMCKYVDYVAYDKMESALMAFNQFKEQEE